MGWFNELITTRIENDDMLFSDACVDLSSVVMGKKVASKLLNDNKKRTLNAVEEILHYFSFDPPEIPDTVEDMNDQLDYMLRPTGIMRRSVNLPKDWYKDAIGPMLGSKKDGGVVALLPHGFAGYRYFDYDTGTTVSLNKKTAQELQNEATCFYQPLPQGELANRDLFRFILKTLRVSDIVMFVAASLAVTLLGLLTPYINKLMFSMVLPSGTLSLILPITSMLLGVAISVFLINITKNLIMMRIEGKMKTSVQAAIMARIL
jgi:ABC-type bacteriocin/lantibiotic exporter with double-glycine peptidase domain